jgi:hypothetical protein
MREEYSPDARQIVCEEWHRAVKEFDLRPGTVTEKVVARIVTRLDEEPIHRSDPNNVSVNKRPFNRKRAVQRE